MQIYGISYNTPNISTNQAKMTIKKNIAFAGNVGTFYKETQPAGKKFLNKFKQIFTNFSLKKINKRYRKTAAPLNNLTPIEKLDGSDFSKLEGEIIFRSGEKVVKNENGVIIRKLHSRNKTRLSHVIDYNPVTNHPVLGACYHDDGKTLSSIIEYAPNNGNFAKYSSYKEDGKTLDFVVEYEPETESILRKIWYEDDGITIKKIEQK